MEHYSSKRSVHYIYPGEYIPSPELEQLAIELEKHREGAVVQPLVNVLDTAESFIVEAAIPGIKRENFLISVKDNVLSIALFTKHSGVPAAGSFQLHEFNYECCDRHILLPDNVNVDLASAEYKEGLLRIYMPKTATAEKNDQQRIVVY